MRSVAWTASRSSGVIREASPMTSAGTRAAASSGSPWVASRSDRRSNPANRWAPPGSAVTSGGPLSRTRSTAANSLPRPGIGSSVLASTSSRVEGRTAAH
ncbi:hypothetical protein ACFV5N_01970 [Streptomyces sp. NPDC059853]|uniref:hypothetical protein n=1 Tax=Streptomyces sp. NPDC059853 TaxID=3346973 RepID=UPI0036646EB2